MTHRTLHVARRADDGARTHEDLFLARYESLLGVARRLVGSDRGSAEDLLHDSYVQFVLSAPELATIEQIDAYLVGLLRNVHLSGRRRQQRYPHCDLTCVDFDSAEMALRASGPHQLHARETLVRICEFVRRRRLRSRAASALALRFFVGFFPSEIAALARTSARQVHNWLQQARSDTRAHLRDPGRRPNGVRPLARLSMASEDPDAVNVALQALLFAPPAAPCPSPDDIAAWYAHPKSAPLATTALAHLAGCRACLDRAASILGFEDASSRHGGDPGNEPPAPGNVRSRDAATRMLRRRARAVVEHRPRQLFVTVNGLPLGQVTPDAARIRARWTVRVQEPAAFVEVMSEQSVVLAHTMVAPLPLGDVCQRQRVLLSEGRSIDLTFDASSELPEVVVEYHHPSWQADAVVEDEAEHDHAATLAVGASRSALAGTRASRWSWWPSSWSSRWTLATATVALLLGVWLGRSRVGGNPTPPPAQIVDRAEAADAADIIAAGTARRRQLTYTRQTPSGATRYRIETWEAGARSTRATRVFDAGGTLVAGDWIDAAGAHTTRPGGLHDAVWLAGLSARAFRPYMAGTSCATEPADSRFVITCERADALSLLRFIVPTLRAQADAPRVRQAVLELDRDTLRARRLTLTLEPGASVTGLVLEEEARADVPLGAVPPGTFDPVLSAPPAATVAPVPRRPNLTATPSLEVQVLEIVGRLPASAVVEVQRRASGQLVLSGYVSSAADRRDLLAAIRALDAGTVVRPSVRTLDEATVPGRAADSPAGPGHVELRDLPSQPAPFERYLAVSGTPVANPEQVTRDLSARLLEPARQVARDTHALAEVLDGFPPEELAALDIAGRTAWRTLSGRHVAASVETLALIETALSPYFPGDAIRRGSDTVCAEPIRSCVQQLARDTSGIAADVSAAFMASATPNALVPLDLHQRIRKAKNLAESIRTTLFTLPDSGGFR